MKLNEQKIFWLQQLGAYCGDEWPVVRYKVAALRSSGHNWCVAVFTSRPVLRSAWLPLISKEFSSQWGVLTPAKPLPLTRK